MASGFPFSPSYIMQMQKDEQTTSAKKNSKKRKKSTDSSGANTPQNKDMNQNKATSNPARRDSGSGNNQNKVEKEEKEVREIKIVKEVKQNDPLDLAEFNRNNNGPDIGNFKIQNIHLGRAVIIAMNSTDELYVSGFCDIALLRGCALVNGFSLSVGEFHSISAPIWSPCLPINAIGKSNKNKKSLNLMEFIRESCPELPQGVISQKTLPQAGTLLLIRGRDTSRLDWMESVEDTSQYTENPNERYILSETTEVIRFQTALVGTQEHIQALNLNSLSISTSWIQSVSKLLHDKKTSNKDGYLQKTVICGSKGVGKSTLLRYLVNGLLSEWDKVCVIDVDVGQPEFSAPGLLSLHVISNPILTLPHFHIDKTPEGCIYFGDITTKSDPQLLSSAINYLYEQYLTVDKTYKESQSKSNAKPLNPFTLLNNEGEVYRSIPLVINCDGNVRFMGAELLAIVLDSVQPTHVLHIENVKDKAMLQGCLPSCVKEVIVCEQGQTKPSNIPSVDLRTLRMASYFLKDSSYLQNLFGQIAAPKQASAVNIRKASIVDFTGHLPMALASLPVYSIPLSSIQFRCIEPSLEVVPRLTLAAFNSAIVGIVPNNASNSDGTDNTCVGSTGTVVRNPRTGTTLSIDCIGPVPFKNCIGLGLVRAIDFENEVLYLIAPNGLDVTSERICLIRGSLQFPWNLTTLQGMTHYPYISAEVAGEGSSEMRARPNMKRRTSRK